MARASLTCDQWPWRPELHLPRRPGGHGRGTAHIRLAVAARVLRLGVQSATRRGTEHRALLVLLVATLASPLAVPLIQALARCVCSQAIREKWRRIPEGIDILVTHGTLPSECCCLLAPSRVCERPTASAMGRRRPTVRPWRLVRRRAQSRLRGLAGRSAGAHTAAVPRVWAHPRGLRREHQWHHGLHQCLDLHVPIRADQPAHHIRHRTTIERAGMNE